MKGDQESALGKVKQLTVQVGMLEADLKREISSAQDVLANVRRTLMQRESELKEAKGKITVSHLNGWD